MPFRSTWIYGTVWNGILFNMLVIKYLLFLSGTKTERVERFFTDF